MAPETVPGSAGTVAAVPTKVPQSDARANATVSVPLVVPAVIVATGAVPPTFRSEPDWSRL